LIGLEQETWGTFDYAAGNVITKMLDGNCFSITLETTILEILPDFIVSSLVLSNAKMLNSFPVLSSP
jgi:hypothetical protein